jgi:hypothetical protein
MVHKSKKQNPKLRGFGAIMAYIIAYLIILLFWTNRTSFYSLLSLIGLVAGAVIGMILLDLFLYVAWGKVHPKNNLKFVVNVVFPLAIYGIILFVYASFYNNFVYMTLEPVPTPPLSFIQEIIYYLFSSIGCFIIVVVGVVAVVLIVLRNYNVPTTT